MCDDFYAVAKQTICYLNDIRLMRYGGIRKKKQLDKVKERRLFRLGRPAQTVDKGRHISAGFF